MNLNVHSCGCSALALASLTSETADRTQGVSFWAALPEQCSISDPTPGTPVAHILPIEMYFLWYLTGCSIIQDYKIVCLVYGWMDDVQSEHDQDRVWVWKTSNIIFEAAEGEWEGRKEGYAREGGFPELQDVFGCNKYRIWLYIMLFFFYNTSICF